MFLPNSDIKHITEKWKGCWTFDFLPCPKTELPFKIKAGQQHKYSQIKLNHSDCSLLLPAKILKDKLNVNITFYFSLRCTMFTIPESNLI